VIEIVGSSSSEAPWCKTFVADVIGIGAAAANQVVLTGAGMRAEHARLERAVGRDAELVLVALADVKVDGKRLRARDPKRRLRPSDRIEIGDHTLAIRDIDPVPIGAQVVAIRAPEEQQLLDAIVARDEASRIVYADWLEARGEHDRAAFLRTELELRDPSNQERQDRLTNRLRELSTRVDLAWRSRVARPAIEGCPQFDFACPKSWASLAATGREGIRHCSACKANVHYCASIEEARAHGAAGRCVALDITGARYEHDLAEPYGTNVCSACGADIGPGRYTCSRCGAALRQMLRGRIRVG
jgi:uncharacterized protein (TIGR02996 family)